MTIRAQLHDGTVLEFPDGTDQTVIQNTVKSVLAQRAGTPAEQRRDAMRANIEAAKAGTMPPLSPARQAEQAAIDANTQDEMILAGRTGPGGRAPLGAFLQGMPFVGSWTDELVGVINGPQAGVQARAEQAAYARQYPGTSTALQVAGGVVGSIPLAIAAAPLMGAAPTSLGGQVLSGALGGAALGGVEGGISGAGRGEPGNRGASAATGAGIGAAFGGAVGALAPAVGRVARAGWENVRGRDVGAISSTLGVDKPAAAVVRNALLYDDPILAQAALKRAGKDAMLADAGPGLARQLDTAMASSPRAFATARAAIGARLDKVSQRLNGVLDAALGAAEGAKSAARGVTQRTAAARDAAYKAAFKTPIDYASDAGRAIEEVLDRLPPNILNRAVAKANEAMRFEGRRNLQIMATISPDGSRVTFQQMPNVEQVHAIKRALSDIAEEGKDALGRMTPDGRLYGNMASAVRDVLVEATGGQSGTYARATKLGGDKIAEQRAFDLGRSALSASTTREEVADAMISTEARLAAARGLRGAIDDLMANVRANFSGQSADIGATVKLVRDMSSAANRTKAALIIGDARAKVLFRMLDEAAAAFETRAAVAVNSQTASRLAGQVAFDAETAPGLATRAMRGELVQAGKQTAQAVTGTSDAALNALKQGHWDQVARALTEIRGPDAARALILVQRAMAGQPMKSGQAQFVGRLLAGATALGGYQSGTRSLTPQ